MKMTYRIVIGLFLVGGISLASDLFVKEAEAHCTWRHIWNHCFGFGGGKGGGSTPAKGNISGKVYEKLSSNLTYDNATVEVEGGAASPTKTDKSASYKFCGGNVQCMPVGTYNVLARKEFAESPSRSASKMGGQRSGVNVSKDTFTNDADIAMCLQTDGGALPCAVQKPVRRY